MRKILWPNFDINFKALSTLNGLSFSFQGQFPLVFNQFLPRGFYGETGLKGGVMLHFVPHITTPCSIQYMITHRSIQYKAAKICYQETDGRAGTNNGLG